VLIVRLGAVGDVVRTLPCLARLREACPHSQLSWLVEAGAAPLLPGKPWLDHTLIFPREIFRPRRLLQSPGEWVTRWYGFFDELRLLRPRLVLDFQGSAKSALLGRLSGAPWRLGFDARGAREGSYLLNNVRISPSDPRLNRVSKNFELL